MHLLCPHCRNPIELVEFQPRQEVNCPACGSSFQLEGGSTAAYEPLHGRTIGKFELLATVGVGAFGTVYKARDPELDRVVALKVPRAGNLATSHDLDRFLREARSVAQLRHPSIVSVHEVGTSDDMPFLVSDFVEGITLADLLSSRRLGFRDAACLCAQLADALQFAHAHGVVHRDVKPSNIMLEAGGLVAPKLMDFGLAKRDAGEITMTVDGQLLGTPAYLSPEMARGEAHRVDGRSDVYSLGVVLYQLLTGELPFRGSTRMLLHQVLHDEPKPPRRLNDRIPRDMETICLKAMAKEPDRRFQTAQEMGRDLERFLKGEPIKARPVSRAEKLWRWCRRKPVVAGLAATLAVVVVASLIGLAALWLRADAQRRLAVDNAWKEGEQRKKAEENFGLARQGIQGFFTEAKEQYNRRRSPTYPDVHESRSGTETPVALHKSLEKAVALYDTLVQRQPGDPELQSERAWAYTWLGYSLHDAGSKTESWNAYEQAVTILKQIVCDHPNVSQYQHDLGLCQFYLGCSYGNTGRPAEAEEAHRKALATLEKYVDEHDPHHGTFHLGEIYQSLGNLMQTNGKPQAALDWYDRAVQTVDSMPPRSYEGITPRDILRDALRERVKILAQLGRHDEVLKDWDRLVELAELPTSRSWFRLQRALAQARAGHDGKARAEAEKLLQDDPTISSYYEPVTSYRQVLHGFVALARIYSLSAKAVPGDAALREQYTKRAVEALRRPGAYFHGVDQIRTDPDFAVLQSHEDFRRLLAEWAEWESKSRPGGRVTDAVLRDYAWPLLWGWPRF